MALFKRIKTNKGFITIMIDDHVHFKSYYLNFKINLLVKIGNNEILKNPDYYISISSDYVYNQFEYEIVNSSDIDNWLIKNQQENQDDIERIKKELEPLLKEWNRFYNHYWERKRTLHKRERQLKELQKMIEANKWDIEVLDKNLTEGSF